MIDNTLQWLKQVHSFKHLENRQKERMCDILTYTLVHCTLYSAQSEDSDVNRYCGDVVLGSFKKLSREEENIKKIIYVQTFLLLWFEFL